MSRDRPVNLEEYAEWIAAVIGAAFAGIARAIYRKVSLRPMLEEIITRLDDMDEEIAALHVKSVENATRLEERRNAP